MTITWTNDKRKLSDLIPWPKNPRQIKEPEAKRLVGSREKFEQPWPIIIGPNNELYDGHQRLNVWGKKWGGDLVVDVRVCSRELTEKEREELVILAHKGTNAGWDFDMLANQFEVGELVEWGFTELELGIAPADDWGAAMDKLPDEDRAPFQQMTFTLHDTQVEIVKEAIKLSGSMGDYGDTQNENGNGNALARVCEMFVGEHDG